MIVLKRFSFVVKEGKEINGYTREVKGKEKGILQISLEMTG